MAFHAVTAQRRQKVMLVSTRRRVVGNCVRSAGFPAVGMRTWLLMHDNGGEGGIDLEAAVIFDEAASSEFVHEEVHAGTGRLTDLR